MNEREYQQLQTEVAEVTRKVERAQGALDEKLRFMREKFAVDTLEDAMQLCAKKEKALAKAKDTLDNAYEEYIAKWKKSL